MQLIIAAFVVLLGLAIKRKPTVEPSAEWFAMEMPDTGHVVWIPLAAGSHPSPNSLPHGVWYIYDEVNQGDENQWIWRP